LFLTLAGFGIYAVAADHQPGFADAMLPDAARLWQALTGQPVVGGWLASTIYRPPLAYTLGALLFLVSSGPHLPVLRFSVLVQFLLLVWLAHATGKRLAGRWAGLLSAATVGTFPLLVGWGRMAYMDIGLALAVLLNIWLLLVTDFERPAHGVRLGAAVGAGMLTKVAFPLFAAGAVFWTLALKLRHRRALATLGVAVVTALGVAGWWYAAQWHMVVLNAGMSKSGGSETLDIMLTSARRLVWDLPGGPTLLLLAAVGSVAAWRLRVVPPSALLLLSLTLWPPLLALLNFVPLRRYMIPVYPQAGVLAASCLVAVVARLRPALVRPLALGGSGGLVLLVFVPMSLGLWRPEVPRTEIYGMSSASVDGLGILSPDTHENHQLEKMTVLARKRGFARCLLVPASSNVQEKHLALQDQLFFDRGDDFFMTSMLKEYHPDPEVWACVMVATPSDPDANGWRASSPQVEQGIYEACRTYAWFQKVRGSATLLGSASSRGVAVRYILYRLPLRALRVPPPRVSYCKLDQVFWDRAMQHQGEDQ